MNRVDGTYRITSVKPLFLVGIVCFLIIIYFYQSARVAVNPIELSEMINRSRSDADSHLDIQHRTYVNLVLFFQAGIGLTFIMVPFVIGIYRNRATLKRLNHRYNYGFAIKDKLAEKKSSESTHSTFEAILLSQFPNLTAYDLKMCSLLRQNYTSKEIADELNITPASVNTARYRLRKKLSLAKGIDLVIFLNRYGT